MKLRKAIEKNHQQDFVSYCDRPQENGMFQDIYVPEIWRNMKYDIGPLKHTFFPRIITLNYFKQID